MQIHHPDSLSCRAGSPHVPSGHYGVILQAHFSGCRLLSEPYRYTVREIASFERFHIAEARALKGRI